MQIAALWFGERCRCGDVASKRRGYALPVRTMLRSQYQILAGRTGWRADFPGVEATGRFVGFDYAIAIFVRDPPSKMSWNMKNPVGMVF
jgi:hypothetical protein